MSVVDKFIMQLEAQLEEKGVTILLSDKARKWLAERGYEPAYGARPLGRVVQEHIKKPLADKLLFGELVMGGEVLIDIKKDDIIINNQNKEKPTDKANFLIWTGDINDKPGYWVEGSDKKVFKPKLCGTNGEDL